MKRPDRFIRLELKNSNVFLTCPSYTHIKGEGGRDTHTHFSKNNPKHDKNNQDISAVHLSQKPRVSMVDIRQSIEIF